MVRIFLPSSVSLVFFFLLSSFSSSVSSYSVPIICQFLPVMLLLLFPVLQVWFLSQYYSCHVPCCCLLFLVLLFCFCLIVIIASCVYSHFHLISETSSSQSEIYLFFLFFLVILPSSCSSFNVSCSSSLKHLFSNSLILLFSVYAYYVRYVLCLCRLSI